MFCKKMVILREEEIYRHGSSIERSKTSEAKLNFSVHLLHTG